VKQPIDILRERSAEGRQILIYGAGSQGRGVLRALRRNAIDVAGFIDRNPSVQGNNVGDLTVHSPDLLRRPASRDHYFIIIAAFFFEREIASFLGGFGYEVGRHFLAYSSLKPHDYAVEVSGVCNLRCISCPRADRRPTDRNAAMMSLDHFRQVIDKIRRESPFVGNLQLYQWGEPTLNPALPAMIRLAREQGFLCSLSSNLNHKADFRALIEALPECLRLSVSGIGENYELTHTGGTWSTFLEHVREIGKLRLELNPQMKVELYYHQYRHSVGDQQGRIAELCRELQFEFHPVPAYIISLDDVLAYAEGTPLPPPACQARKLLLVDIDEGLQRAKAEAALPCDALRVIMINADLSVSTCMMFYDPEGNTLVQNFLSTPLETIVERRKRAPLCGRCMKHGIHRYCSVYAQLSEERRY